MELRQVTQDLHHACERHPIGQALANGTVTDQQYADWLLVQLRIHEAIDPHLAPELERASAMQADIDTLDIVPHESRMAEAYAETLTYDAARAGAAYVMVGAHLMGGAMIARAVGDRLPHDHIPKGEERQTMLRAWRPLRERADLANEAVRCFGALLASMEEIRQKTA